MATPVETVDSLERLIEALEGEQQRLNSGQQPKPQRFVLQFLLAVRRLSECPEAKARLIARYKDLKNQFAPGNAIDRLRESLVSELAKISPENRPEETSEADASRMLDDWRGELEGPVLERLREFATSAEHELFESFLDWRLPQSTSDALNELMAELTVASAETPWRALVAFVGLGLKRKGKSAAAELFAGKDKEKAPSVADLLSTAKWLVSQVKTLPKVEPPPDGNAAGGGQGEADEPSSAGVEATKQSTTPAKPQPGTPPGDNATGGGRGDANGGQTKEPQRGWKLAYYASNYMEGKRGCRLSAEDVWDYWKEYGFDPADRDTKNAAELAGYVVPPSFETFKTYLSKGRAWFKDRRNEDRKRRRGRSIVSGDEID